MENAWPRKTTQVSISPPLPWKSIIFHESALTGKRQHALLAQLLQDSLSPHSITLAYWSTFKWSPLRNSQSVGAPQQKKVLTGPVRIAILGKSNRRLTEEKKGSLGFSLSIFFCLSHLKLMRKEGLIFFTLVTLWNHEQSGYVAFHSTHSSWYESQCHSNQIYHTLTLTTNKLPDQWWN